MYLLIALGEGSQTWPAIVHHTMPWDMWHGVGMSYAFRYLGPGIGLLIEFAFTLALRREVLRDAM